MSDWPLPSADSILPKTNDEKSVLADSWTNSCFFLFRNIFFHTLDSAGRHVLGCARRTRDKKGRWAHALASTGAAGRVVHQLTPQSQKDRSLR